MEIYKMGDFEEGSIGELRITDIKPAVRSENRVNVYVNGKYSFSLDLAQVVELSVKVGMVVDTERLAELKRASEFGKAYQRALEWVLMRPRSVKELKDYLKRRGRTEDAKDKRREWEDERALADAVASGDETNLRRVQSKMARTGARVKYDFDGLIVKRLIDRGYVDDLRFAEYYVENRFAKKGISQKRLRMELKQKGVADGIIRQVLDDSERSDEDEIRKIITKKREKYDDEKLIRYLCRQGFSYEQVRELVRSSGTD